MYMSLFSAETANHVICLVLFHLEDDAQTANWDNFTKLIEKSQSVCCLYTYVLRVALE